MDLPPGHLQGMYSLSRNSSSMQNLFLNVCIWQKNVMYSTPSLLDITYLLPAVSLLRSRVRDRRLLKPYSLLAIQSMDRSREVL
jgi:hypothetical protein